jgi:hypothetical protein
MTKIVHIYLSWKRILGLVLGKPLILEFPNDVVSFVGGNKLFIRGVEQ